MNNFSFFNTKALNIMYNNKNQKAETLKEDRKAFKQEIVNQIEVFMQNKFGKSVKVAMLEVIFSELSQIKFTFDNSFNSSLTLDFGENEETGKFEVKINNSFTYVDFNLTSNNNADTTKINVIYYLVNNIDNTKDFLVEKLENAYSVFKKYRTEKRELFNDMTEIAKEINNRKLIKNDEEIWNSIKNDEKLQKKYVIVKRTNEKTYIMHNGENGVHIYSTPKTKTELKKEPAYNDGKEIVKVSELSMLLH